MSLRLVLMGTPDFAVPTFDRLISDGHAIAAVYTQPPRPAGRGMAARPSPVEALARRNGLHVETPLSLRPEEDLKKLEAWRADAAVVVAYGLLLPPRALAAFRLGAYNLHASKLPRWRGAAPIQRAIMAGDRVTAASVMRMEEGLDTGPVCREADVPITCATTAQDLHDALARAGAELMSEAMKALEAGTLTCRPQATDGVNYAAKIAKVEAKIEFAQPAPSVVAHIHGLSPFPGAWCLLDGQRVKLLRAEVVAGSGAPGTVLDEQFTIACGEGAIRPVVVQREGKSQLPLEVFLRGQPVAPGTVVG
ncbi:MAG: methionyl-tRNA formyltransferase [Hyphomicrobiales bacterium]